METAALDCESYRDLPAAGTTLAIRNDRSTPIYLKQFGGCDEIELSFIDVEDGAGAHVDTRGSGVCEWPSCSEAQDLGDVGRVGYCAPCSGEPLLRLEPGAQSEALISINRFVVYGVAPAEAMPEACVAGADPSSLSGLACRAQVPVPAGDYVVKAQAFLDVRCRSGEPTCDCTPENGQCIAADVEGVGEISVAATMIALPTPWLSIAFP